MLIPKFGDIMHQGNPGQQDCTDDEGILMIISATPIEFSLTEFRGWALVLRQREPDSYWRTGKVDTYTYRTNQDNCWHLPPTEENA